MKLKNICYLIILVSVILFSATILYQQFFIYTPQKFNLSQLKQPILIAHAGGKINGHTYTNSLEALEQSFKNGYEFVEIDILESCDGYLVAAHTWKEFHTITGHATNTEQCVNKDEFLKREIHNKFTPITAKELSKFFSEHPNMYLVTDKIKNYDAVKQQLNISDERLLVETFSFNQYTNALKSKIKYPMLCTWTKKELLADWDKIIAGKVAIITIPSKIIPSCEQELKELYERGVIIFSFTENSTTNVSKYVNKYVTGFYTDTLTLDDFNTSDTKN